MPNITDMSPASGRLLRENNTVINYADVLISGVYKVPVNVSATVSIAASGTGTVTITVPAGKRYYVKQVNITKGADVTVTALTFDSNETGQTASFDCVTVFGELLTADTSIDISGSNAGAAAEDLTIQITGYAVDR